ncbi:MAG: hypothetical protein OXP73_07655 [Chloroflexota bacterium]|nr:hypothetical protein [Chloroflexota bacterium]
MRRARGHVRGAVRETLIRLREALTGVQTADEGDSGTSSSTS